MKEPLTYRDLIQAQLDGKTVQYYNSAKEGWADYHITLSTDLGHLDSEVNTDVYRIKPDLKRYCNGVELDECITNEKDVGDEVYIPTPFSRYFYNVWRGSSVNQELIDKGLIYNNAKSAAKHGKAMAIVETRVTGDD